MFWQSPLGAGDARSHVAPGLSDAGDDPRYRESRRPHPARSRRPVRGPFAPTPPDRFRNDGSETSQCLAGADPGRRGGACNTPAGRAMRDIVMISVLLTKRLCGRGLTARRVVSEHHDIAALMLVLEQCRRRGNRSFGLQRIRAGIQNIWIAVKRMISHHGGTGATIPGVRLPPDASTSRLQVPPARYPRRTDQGTLCPCSARFQGQAGYPARRRMPWIPASLISRADRVAASGAGQHCRRPALAGITGGDGGTVRQIPEPYRPCS